MTTTKGTRTTMTFPSPRSPWIEQCWEHFQAQRRTGLPIKRRTRKVQRSLDTLLLVFASVKANLLSMTAGCRPLPKRRLQSPEHFLPVKLFRNSSKGCSNGQTAHNLDPHRRRHHPASTNYKHCPSQATFRLKQVTDRDHRPQIRFLKLSNPL